MSPFFRQLYDIHKLVDSEVEEYGKTIHLIQLKDKPQTYTTDGTNADTDNEWTFVDGDHTLPIKGLITTRWKWEYDGINTGTDSDTTGTLSRESLSSE